MKPYGRNESGFHSYSQEQCLKWKIIIFAWVNAIEFVSKHTQGAKEREREGNREVKESEGDI